MSCRGRAVDLLRFPEGRFYQGVLCRLLFWENGHNTFVHCSSRDYVVDEHRVFLSRAVQPLVQLLVVFEAPAEAVPDRDTSAVLEVQAVTG